MNDHIEQVASLNNKIMGLHRDN